MGWLAAPGVTAGSAVDGRGVWQVYAANPKAVLERSADGLFIPMTPPGGDTGRRTARLLGSGRLEPPT